MSGIPPVSPSPVARVPSGSSGGVPVLDPGPWTDSVIGLVMCLVLFGLLLWGLWVAMRWALTEDRIERSVERLRRDLES